MVYEKPEMDVIDFKGNVVALKIEVSGDPDSSDTGGEEW